MSIKRLKNNLLHLNNLRKIAGFSIINAAIKSQSKLEILNAPPRGNVLVLVPHPDDDIIGCGGTLKLHADQSDDIKIVYFTNAGTKREAETKRAISTLLCHSCPFGKLRTGSSRNPESLNQIKHVDLTFLNQKDGQISSDNIAIKQLSNLIEAFKPELVYVPSFLDPHPDHFEVCQIFRTLLRSHPELAEFQIFSYEVWSPIYANRLINIDSTFKYKVDALKEHQSQLDSRSYINAIEGLAMYRAGMFNAGKYAEAFFACNRELYLKLFDLVDFK